MKILLLEKYPEIKKKYLKYLEKNHKIFELWENFFDEEVEILMIRSKIFVDEKLLKKYPNVKIICRIWVWLDKINKKLCEEKWIKILNTPNANSDSVADLVLAGILNLSRNLHKIEKKSWWENFLYSRFDFMWDEIWWKTVWIIGFWNIWKKVCERLKWFWVKNFLIFDPFLDKKTIEKNHFCKKIEKKEDIFSDSDIISFHVPLLDSTKKFLWKEEFWLLKNNALLVNTSRWWIINEKYLIEFLEKNSEAKFFWDVWNWESEWKNPDEKLIWLKNVVICPHIWAMTHKAEEKMHYFNI